MKTRYYFLNNKLSVDIPNVTFDENRVYLEQERNNSVNEKEYLFVTLVNEKYK